MQIVINMPEEQYKRICNHTDGIYDGISLLTIVENGTPLPEGHGRLIDADDLYGNFIDGTEGYDCNTWSRIEIGDIIEDTPPIIESKPENWTER